MRYVVTGGTGQLYLGYPDSAAARGVVENRPAASPMRRPKRPVRPLPALRVPRTLKRAVRLVPGVHW